MRLNGGSVHSINVRVGRKLRFWGSIVGIPEKELSRQFQLTADLTLMKVIQETRHTKLITRRVNLEANHTTPG